MTSDEISLRRFGRYCRSFYDSSLILRPSSSSVSSTKEEKKSVDNNNYKAIDVKAEKEDGRIVIETLDRITAIRSLVLSSQQSQTQKTNTSKNCNAELQNTIASLRQEHALIVAHAHHSQILMECGLLDIDRFIFSRRTKNDPHPHYDDSSCLLLQQYTKLRDAVRRRAHQTAMLHRQHSLFDLLSQLSSSASVNADHSATKSLTTEVNTMHHSISIIQNFVRKYRSNVGSHSFLAGLHRLVEMQLTAKRSNDPFYIVRWRFNGSILTEACQTNHIGRNYSKDDDNDLVYAQDAIQALFSFLIRVNQENDIESGEVGSIVPILDEDDDGTGFDVLTTEGVVPEVILSFEVDKYISNKKLRRILDVLPDPKFLDARATGNFTVVDASSSVANDGMAYNQALVPRKNVDGYDDEQWQWFSRLQFCHVL